eukprot:CAMPEP_0198212466 /NCGR_PEP_ID=MMETSP1445-20131203/26190_1 /TAXON_ID=36898 /ORGANISM="Pyramimonas sp., Strain CCMP2087" /LENGTH=152 /DNA_ID=CAMNT_0043886919 /DNA_START=138 /DNA_END=596 /DNA_ORIENTATION=-
MVYGDDPRKPVDIDNELMCEACHAIVDVATKRVKKWNEDSVYTVLDNLCKDATAFRVYKMIPPTMQKGCEAFIDRYGDGFEDALYKAGPETADEKICVAHKVCKGYEFTPPPSSAGTVPKAEPEGSKKAKKKSKKAKKKAKKQEAEATKEEF